MRSGADHEAPSTDGHVAAGASPQQGGGEALAGMVGWFAVRPLRRGGTAPQALGTALEGCNGSILIDIRMLGGGWFRSPVPRHYSWVEVMGAVHEGAAGFDRWGRLWHTF